MRMTSWLSRTTCSTLRSVVSSTMCSTLRSVVSSTNLSTRSVSNLRTNRRARARRASMWSSFSSWRRRHRCYSRPRARRQKAPSQAQHFAGSWPSAERRRRLPLPFPAQPVRANGRHSRERGSDPEALRRESRCGQSPGEMEASMAPVGFVGGRSLGRRRTVQGDDQCWIHECGVTSSRRSTAG